MNSFAVGEANVQRSTPQASQHPTPRWWWIFYLSLAFGFLAKGPIAWLPLLTVGAAIIFARDWQLARHLKFVRGILLMLAVVALWGIPALVQTHGQFLAIGIGRHVMSRSFRRWKVTGANSLGMYLLLAAVLSLWQSSSVFSLVDQVAMANATIVGKAGRDRATR